MQYRKPASRDVAEVRQIAQQASVELAIFMAIDQALRDALKWMTQGRPNCYKLSTLRFHALSFERHLTRIHVLADHGGYLHLITDTDPTADREVRALWSQREDLHQELERIILRLDYVRGDDADVFKRLCADVDGLLDSLKEHSRKERDLIQLCFAQEDSGSG